MNDKWEGFTQEEILDISNQKYQYTKDLTTSSSPVKKTTFKQSRYAKKNMTRERMLNTQQNQPLASGEKQPALPQEAKLFIPQIPEESEVNIKVKSAEVIVPPSSSEPKPSSDIKNNSHPNVLHNNHIGSAGDVKTSDGLIMKSNHTPVLPDNASESSSELKNPNDLVRNNIYTPVLFTAPGEANLEDFERRQKMMEEQNQKRKALLKKALEDRTKKTHEEALRLSEIEQELKKLDIQLSSDVSILRKQIEVATLELTDAQRRFDRAEQEYLDAKLALFTKRERKELLTAHLCTIIEQNELRKAKKLSNLMDKLQLGSVIIEKPMEVPVEKKEEAIESKESSDKPIPNECPSPPS